MNMKTPIRYAAILALTVGCVSLFAASKYCDLSETYGTSSSSNSPNQQKQCLCHNAGPNLQKKTLCLPPSAYNAHIKKGDTPGPCPTN